MYQISNKIIIQFMIYIIFYTVYNRYLMEEYGFSLVAVFAIKLEMISN
jgi:hypothetical protein